jgi:hypothetical protein
MPDDKESPWYKPLIERYPVGIVFCGAAFVLIGATGAIPKLDQRVQGEFFEYGLFFVGLLLLVFGAYLLLRSPPDDDLDLKKYRVKILKPAGGKIPPPVELTGTIERLPPEKYELWLLNKGIKDGQTNYWPQRRLVDFVQTENSFTWTTTYKAVRYSDGDSRELLLYFVGPDGQALITAYYKINKRLGDDVPWEGIALLTKDMKKAAGVNFYLAKY